jgi:hypothetical protein
MKTTNSRLTKEGIKMSRQKRSSPIVERADFRLQSIKSMATPLDLGGGLSALAFEAEIDTAQGILDDYNQLLALLDEKLVMLREAEKRVADFSERIMAGVAARYGKDSAEYAHAGGIRKSDIKRSPRRTPAKPTLSPS